MLGEHLTPKFSGPEPLQRTVNEVPTVKTQFCDQCQHAKFANCLDGKFRLACAVGHRPKFFAPRFEMDHIWGYKRKCRDFDKREATKGDER